MLLDQRCLPYVEVVDFNSFSDLPPPVARYFKHVLVDGQKLIEIAKMHQWGMLRTNMKQRYMVFVHRASDHSTTSWFHLECKGRNASGRSCTRSGQLLCWRRCG